jgi:Flp pilus assembly pilin Flp
MTRRKRWLDKWLHKDRADVVEYALLLSVVLLSAVATGCALTHTIGKDFNTIANTL